MLEVRGITKVYGKGRMQVDALRGVDINFGARGLIVILGKSGSGKSTLLNVIGGLDKPSGGEIIINGRSSRTFSLADFDAYRNTFVGMVFQEFNLIDDISVYDNINMTLKLQEKDADVNTVDDVLSMVGLGNMGYRKPNELSGGQRQRVAMARALLKKPEIILADEPTGALDSATGESVFETLKHIAESKLVIVVTHDRGLAHAFGDRIIEIVDGRIVSDISRKGIKGEGASVLSESVIEVPIGAEVSAEMLNASIDPSKVNYIGLSNDKDRIALSYPETVDVLYVDTKKSGFSPTTEDNISKDNKPFAVSKGRLQIKDTVKMARASIKRMKKRYRLLTRLCIICFVFVAVSMLVSDVNVSKIVAESAFDSSSTPVVKVTREPSSNDYYYGEAQKLPLSESHISSIKEASGQLNVGELRSFTLSPMFATIENTEQANFSLTAFTGVVEGATADQLGVKLLSKVGNGTPENFYEIVISDMAAFEMQRSGFVGYLAGSNEFGIHYPKSPKDLAGCRIKLIETGRLYTVKAVFATNYEKYSSLAGASSIYAGMGLNQKSTDLLTEFLSNRDHLYSKVFAKTGFTLQALENGAIASSKEGYTISMRGNYGKVSYDYPINNLVYDGNNTENIEWISYASAPTALADNEVVLFYSSAAEMFSIHLGDYLKKDKDEINPYWFTDEDIDYQALAAEIKRITTGNTYTLEVYNGGNTWDRPLYSGSVKIAGITFGSQQRAYISRNILDEFLKEIPLNAVFLPRGSGAGGLEKSVNNLREEGFYTSTAAVNMQYIIYIESIVEILSTIFFWVALAFSILAILIILNYMSASVKFRTKEIAVYRVIGAKISDVIKIFMSENFFITLKTTIWASIFVFIATLLLNDTFASAVNMFNLRFALVSFSFFHPLLLFVGIGLFVSLCSLPPILGIALKRPAQAVKLI